ncbi:MAG: hypothetical protein ACOYOF_12120, partial [Verrucomicrobiaceae bacterium]
YIGLGWALPFSFYQEAIDKALPKGGRISIVTDDTQDAFFLRFRQWKPVFFKGTPLQQMSYMSHAPRLVMSASTFSWWPAFLGNAEMVVCPVPAFGIWSSKDRAEGIDLVDRSRFHCLDCPTPYTLSPLESLYQRARSYRSRATRWVNETFHTRFPVQHF